MQFPESWLRSLVDTPLSTNELAEKLTMAGLEVEELDPVAPPFSGVVVGLVLTREKHPNADRLSVCTVQVDGDAPRQIVCGAPNVAPGLKVPCALPGAVLPGNFKIKPTKMRGVESGGMLCAGKELGISSDGDGLLVLPENLEVGQDIRQALKLDEMVFTLKMTPNRADCLSVYGVAREVAALTGATLKPYDFSPVPSQVKDVRSVDVQATDLCGRFVGRVLRGVDNSVPTPQWMVRRLEQAGQRSLNALVDISNYVMLELGRPTHVFDLNTLKGDLTVRWAHLGETLELLNEQTVKLTERFGIISDDQGPQALAGVMGGNSSAVTEGTTDIFLEAAFWYPEAIAGRARELNFSSEASHRFERGVDPSFVAEHLEWMTRLIQEICGGQAGPTVDQSYDPPQPNTVIMRHKRCEQVIGMPFERDQLQTVFARLGFICEVSEQGGDVLYSVTAPTFRFDIQIEEDLIEEVVRVVGYENLPLRAPLAKLTSLPQPETLSSRDSIRHRVAALGYQEVVTYSFTPDQWETDFSNNQDPVRLLNPIASHLCVMRSSLIGSLIAVLKHNLGHRVDRLRVFEVARTFEKHPDAKDGSLTVAGFEQVWRLGGLAYGLSNPLQWADDQRQVDFFDVKGDLETLLNGRRLQFKPFDHPALHPGRCAEVIEKGRRIGFIGELHPKWLKVYELPSAPLVFQLDLEPVLGRKLPSYKEVSKHPVVIRDLAFVVNRAEQVDRVKKVMQACPSAENDWLKSVILFDEFTPAQEGKGLGLNEKSLAFRLRFQASDRSLTDQDLEPLLAGMVQSVTSECQARLR